MKCICSEKTRKKTHLSSTACGLCKLCTLPFEPSAKKTIAIICRPKKTVKVLSIVGDRTSHESVGSVDFICSFICTKIVSKPVKVVVFPPKNALLLLFQNRASDVPKLKGEKQLKPVSQRVNDAAEGLLTVIMDHVVRNMELG